MRRMRTLSLATVLLSSAATADVVMDAKVMPCAAYNAVLWMHSQGIKPTNTNADGSTNWEVGFKRVSQTKRDQNREEACGKDLEKTIRDGINDFNATNKLQNEFAVTCDEFPFAVSSAGGADANVMGITGAENSKQGGAVVAGITGIAVGQNFTVRVNNWNNDLKKNLIKDNLGKQPNGNGQDVYICYFIPS